MRLPEAVTLLGVLNSSVPPVTENAPPFSCALLSSIVTRFLNVVLPSELTKPPA